MLRARLRSSLASLHKLSTLSVSHVVSQRFANEALPPSAPKPPKRRRWKFYGVALVVLLTSLLCFVILRPTEEIKHRCSGVSSSVPRHGLCFASLWSHSLCLVIPSFFSSRASTSSFCYSDIPPT